MTNEEAIADIRDNIKPVVGGKSLDMAIKALDQLPCEDCISREAVRTILANQRDELIKLHTVNPKDNPKADAMAYGVNWSLNTLMELPSVTPKARWIPVSDRLPEEYGDYLVTVKIELYELKPFYEVRLAPFDGRDFNIGFMGDGVRVISWKTLPDAYKESEEKA